MIIQIASFFHCNALKNDSVLCNPIGSFRNSGRVYLGASMKAGEGGAPFKMGWGGDWLQSKAVGINTDTDFE